MENQKRILIVEDSPTVVTHMNMLLKDKNVKLIDVGSEFGMMQSIESFGKLVDLILMDLTLKSENGMDLIRNLRKNEKYKNLPIIIITEHAKKDLILEAKGLNVSGYLRKPIEKKLLVERIEGVLGDISLNRADTNLEPTAEETENASDDTQGQDSEETTAPQE